ncbi:MAG TPA: hypothetical protein ENH10_06845 [Bacteroidetes bacterium]|nr:hypothetical protein [Bacteroidota bacterium]HEX04859.1 hypothetical protein [Bacteroidota bacterium]
MLDGREPCAQKEGGCGAGAPPVFPEGAFSTRSLDECEFVREFGRRLMSHTDFDAYEFEGGLWLIDPEPEPEPEPAGIPIVVDLATTEFELPTDYTGERQALYTDGVNFEALDAIYPRRAVKSKHSDEEEERPGLGSHTVPTALKKDPNWSVYSKAEIEELLKPYKELLLEAQCVVRGDYNRIEDILLWVIKANDLLDA